MYIYILSSAEISVSFYQNFSVWADRLDSQSWDRNPVDSMCVCVCVCEIEKER